MLLRFNQMLKISLFFQMLALRALVQVYTATARINSTASSATAFGAKLPAPQKSQLRHSQQQPPKTEAPTETAPEATAFKATVLQAHGSIKTAALLTETAPIAHHPQQYHSQ